MVTTQFVWRTKTRFALQVEIIERDGEFVFVFVGISNRDRYAPPIEIGRTRSVHSGFAKIYLEPDWQFAKRTF
jgi:N-acetylmuramoyl-L-alanine amidase